MYSRLFELLTSLLCQSYGHMSILPLAQTRFLKPIHVFLEQALVPPFMPSCCKDHCDGTQDELCSDIFNIIIILSRVSFVRTPRVTMPWAVFLSPHIMMFWTLYQTSPSLGGHIASRSHGPCEQSRRQSLISDRQRPDGPVAGASHWFIWARVRELSFQVGSCG